jgi:hypothetical protein
MTLAVMQPYLFPYAGYFQLVNCADIFIFYDDVSFIKGGWINRNQILNAAKPLMFTCPLSNASSNVDIKDVCTTDLDRFLRKFEKQLSQCYRKAPYFDEISSLVMRVFENGAKTISELSIASITECSNYIGLECRFQVSSSDFADTKGLDRASRLIEIAKRCGSDRYVNMPGGRDLYHVESFAEHGVELRFIDSNPIEYQQFKNPFLPYLSIIDVLMFNSPEQVRHMARDYRLGV